MGERIETEKARHAYYHSLQRCVKCGQQDAFTLIGKRFCADCTEKYSRSSTNYGKKHRKERNAYKAEWTRKRKKAGLCPRCGKPSEKGYSHCARCRARDNAQRAENRREKAQFYWLDGICWTCRKHPALDGQKLCAECYEKSLANLEKAREAEKETGENVWVKYYAKPKADA